MEAVGRLAGGIAHDFNNLLTAILGTTQLLLRDLEPGVTMRDDVEEIRKAALRAADLTRQLLAYSRRQVLAPKVLDLNTVVANLDTMLRRLIGEDVQLVTELAPHLPTIQADPSQLEQVILNLIVNSRDAMPHGGRVTRRTAPARRAYPRRGNRSVGRGRGGSAPRRGEDARGERLPGAVRQGRPRRAGRRRPGGGQDRPPPHRHGDARDDGPRARGTADGDPARDPCALHVGLHRGRSRARDGRRRRPRLPAEALRSRDPRAQSA